MTNLTYNEKQYKLIAKYLEKFEKQELKINMFINVIDALLETLEQPDEEWKETFRSEWWTLEEIYAVTLDRGEIPLAPEEYRGFINETIKNMKSLLQKQGIEV